MFAVAFERWCAIHVSTAVHNSKLDRRDAASRTLPARRPLRMRLRARHARIRRAGRGAARSRARIAASGAENSAIEPGRVRR